MKKIALVGTSPSCWRDAPFGDDSWEIWSVSGCYEAIPRYNAWFELHKEEEVLTGMAPAYTEFCKEAGDKLFVFEKMQRFPEATLFPRNEILAEFGEYFTSSIAWMLGLAISMKPQEIGLWGIDMISPDNEYHRQRACCEYYVGLAKGKGIKVTIPEKSALCKGGLYPSKSMIDVNTRIKATTESYEKARDDFNYYRGIKDVLDDMQIQWA